MTIDEQQLFQGAYLELVQASSPYLSLDLEAKQALTVLGVLQLVTRHPNLPDNVREIVEGLADSIECQLAALGPYTREMCRLGWLTDSDDDAA